MRVVLFKPKTPGTSPGGTLANFFQGDLESDNFFCPILLISLVIWLVSSGLSS